MATNRKIRVGIVGVDRKDFPRPARRQRNCRRRCSRILSGPGGMRHGTEFYRLSAVETKNSKPGRITPIAGSAVFGKKNGLRGAAAEGIGVLDWSLGQLHTLPAPNPGRGPLLVPLSAPSDQFCGRRLSPPGRAGAFGLAIIIEGAWGRLACVLHEVIRSIRPISIGLLS